ncbi:hypothetical protein MNB_SV-15-198 [hydrothermal vent metagenome]|uniref:DUF1456 domain-containing protein n=1 Tax=hydrothermal vent metagenome TaxID=652676 RepID=A0A1W1EJJ9_9ZZZZ
MQNSHIIKKISKALSLRKDDIQKIYKLEDKNYTLEDIDKILIETTYEDLGIFLDGLITLKRGKLDNPKKIVDVELTNNLILKKLRVALNLKSSEVIIIFSLVDIELKMSEVNALFRREGSKNYRVCSSKLLSIFLDGLDEFYYSGNID